MFPGLDPISTQILKDVAGEATKTLIQAASTSFKKWLSKYFQDYPEEASSKAEQNAMLFLGDLAQRLNQLEQKLNISDKSQFAITLKDPDFSATFKSAIINSARTSSTEKHILLSSLIVDRLQAAPESLKALTTSLAVDTVPHLTGNQLLLLGLAAFIYKFKFKLHQDEMEKPESDRAKTYKGFWEENISYFVPKVKVSPNDISHLAGLNCITFQTFLAHSLAPTMQRVVVDDEIDWGIDDFLANNETGQVLQKIWQAGLTGCNLTTIGDLIGFHVYYIQSGNFVDMTAWDLNQA